MSDNKSINPICWVPTVYFAMGLPFVALSMVSVLMFSDVFDYAPLDIETFVESFSGDV